MTTENLTPQSEVITTTEQEPTQTTEVEPNQHVDANPVTNLMSGADTSTKDVDWEKRYKDLQSFQSKRENELRDKIKGLEFVEPSTPAETETQTIESPIAETSNMNEFTSARAKIAASHPDFMSVVQSAEFTTWAKTQSANVQNWIYKNPDDPELAIFALDRYKATLATPTTQAAPVEEVHPEKETTVDTLGAAMAVGTSSTPMTKEGKKIWRASDIKHMTSRDWKANSAEIDLAYSEGRVNFKA